MCREDSGRVAKIRVLGGTCGIELGIEGKNAVGGADMSLAGGVGDVDADDVDDENDENFWDVVDDDDKCDARRDDERRKIIEESCNGFNLSRW